MVVDPKKCSPSVKVMIHASSTGHDGAFCSGVVQLLKGVQETGTLFHAAARMGMAYSKAWKLLKAARIEFDNSLIEHTGGHVYELTNDAVVLIGVYDEMVLSMNTLIATEWEGIVKRHNKELRLRLAEEAKEARERVKEKMKGKKKDKEQ
jgi:molybdate transport system regulatory protein